MNTVKKLIGAILLLLAPALVWLMTGQAMDKISKAAEGTDRTNVSLQWGIILFIFIPVSIGMMIFGWYALKGEYNEEVEH
ncbi:MAG: hypothetical protein IM638_10585 [Bacteroidetes bacterium]|nr:hypothetical protein [Bacteroidota bacterium]